jgi:hypothetical protein
MENKIMYEKTGIYMKEGAKIGFGGCITIEVEKKSY